MYKKVSVGRKILSANEEYALKNRQLFAGQRKLCLNMISSPGSGKTTILARTITELKDRIKMGLRFSQYQPKPARDSPIGVIG